MHNNLLKMGTAKMAGSVGNVVNVADLLQRHHPETVRFLLLSTHYRSPIEYSEDRLNEIKRSLDGFYRFFERYERIRRESFYSLPASVSERFAGAMDKGWAHREFGNRVGELRRRFMASMDDDLNTGGAIGVLHELLTVLNKFANEGRIEDPNMMSMELGIDFGRATAVLGEFSSILVLFSARASAA